MPPSADAPDRWADLAAKVGEELATSQPQVIDQETVDGHAATTGDEQWIHNDPVRATADGPFGGPIVQGFLLLSLLTAHSGELVLPALGPISLGVNYGFDRVRFHHPVPVGAAVSARSTLAQVRPKDDGTAVVGIEVSVDVVDEGGERSPAVAARWLFLAVP
jgi:acyl dehydratase